MLVDGGFLVLGGIGKPRNDARDVRRRKRASRLETKKGDSDMGDRFFEWVNRRYVRITVVVLITAVLFTGVSVAIGSDEEPAFDPSGEIYVTAIRVEDLFAVTTGVQGAVFLVEDPTRNRHSIRPVRSTSPRIGWKTCLRSLRGCRGLCSSLRILTRAMF